MVDKSFLININKIFVLIRFDINHQANIELLSLVKKHFGLQGQNNNFLDDVHKSSKMVQDYVSNVLIDKTSININVEEKFKRIFSYVLTKLIYLLKKNKFIQAYELIDAFHFFPELAAEGIETNYSHFMEIYIKPLKAKLEEQFFTELLNEFI